MVNLFKILILGIFALLLSFSNMNAQANTVSNKLYPSLIYPNIFEINRINFIDTSSQLVQNLPDLITSQPTESNFPYRFFSAMYSQFEKNTSTPQFLMKEFQIGLTDLHDNSTVFDKNIASNDVESIRNYFQIKGYHQALINYRFNANPVKKENILEFEINSGERFKIDSVIYYGFEFLPKEILQKIDERKKVKKGDYFDEEKLSFDFATIQNYLKNNGYYYVEYSTPTVQNDTINFVDIVEVQFHSLQRFRVGEIHYIDSTNNQPIVSRGLKTEQMQFATGEWVDNSKINLTKDAYLSLGLFDIVAIDTTSRFVPQTDTTLNFVVFLSYRKQQEYGVGFSLNQTRIDNLVNFGVELNYRHRNFLNVAQEFSPFANIYLKDISTTLMTGNYEYETQLGFKFTQPLLWTIDNSRISLLTSLTYSIRSMNNYFTIATFNVPISFIIKFPKITYFNRGSIDLQFLRENPINFESALDKAFSSATNFTDTNNILQAFIQYSDLNEYLQGPNFHFFTSNIIGFSLTGDSRNDPFSPTRGYFTFVGFDGWNPLFFHSSVSGLARFLRFQLTQYNFFKVTPTTTLALKGKFGAIGLLEDGNSYVPIDRQLFAGGANSIRAWAPRTLRYTKYTYDSVGGNENTYRFLQNFIGNGVLVEGSVELRFGFAKPHGMNKVMKGIVESLKTTMFLDFGNAFHWFLDNEDIEVKATDYITKLAVGTGVGLRYETPIGPVRFDLATPVYDPMGKLKPFGSVSFNFGLGHSF